MRPRVCERLQSLHYHALIFSFLAEFIEKYPELIPEGNAMGFLSDDGGKSYNKCHCKSIYLGPFSLPFRIFNSRERGTFDSLEQLRDRRPQLLAKRALYEVLRAPGQQGRFLLRAMGRCPSPLYRRRAPSTEGEDSLL